MYGAHPKPANPGTELREHAWRRGHGLQVRFWSDWQADEGAAMDAPGTWHPAGSTRGTVLGQGTGSPWIIRSGYVLAPVIPPAVQQAIVDVDGVRYRARLERCGRAQRLAEARAERPGARRLRKGSPTWYRVERAAWSATS